MMQCSLRHSICCTAILTKPFRVQNLTAFEMRLSRTCGRPQVKNAAEVDATHLRESRRILDDIARHALFVDLVDDILHAKKRLRRPQPGTITSGLPRAISRHV
jgi:hypothetical protein